MRRAGLQKVRLKERRDIGAAVTIARPTFGQQRRLTVRRLLSVLPNNRTFSVSLGMSQKCQTRK
jgi:hypothetical protein